MAYTTKSEGESVVKEVVDTINDLGIFPNDHDFLCRVAWVESKYGEASGTYRSGYHGGIWQVRRITPPPPPAAQRCRNTKHDIIDSLTQDAAKVN